jgi:hypothetical protein
MAEARASRAAQAELLVDRAHGVRHSHPMARKIRLQWVAQHVVMGGCPNTAVVEMMDALHDLPRNLPMMASMF